MCSDSQCRRRSMDEEPADYEQQLKLIFDLTRRIRLLEELMQAARARRRSTFEDVSVPAIPGLV